MDTFSIIITAVYSTALKISVTSNVILFCITIKRLKKPIDYILLNVTTSDILLSAASTFDAITFHAKIWKFGVHRINYYLNDLIACKVFLDMQTIFITGAVYLQIIQKDHSNNMVFSSNNPNTKHRDIKSAK